MVTGRMATMIDAIIVNNTNDEKLTATDNVGYCDHLAQVLYIKTKKLPKGPISTYNRHFTDNNIAEFKYLLHKETSDEVLEPEEPNTAVYLFMNSFYVGYPESKFCLQILLLQRCGHDGAHAFRVF
jgi:hypothetical protein